jgi:hypothetical protein
MSSFAPRNTRSFRISASSCVIAPLSTAFLLFSYAAKLLPPHLRPEAKPNPIDKLHDLTSDGLHSKSEEECIDIFDKARKVFEYVFGNLQVQIEEARAFVQSLGQLQPSPKSDKSTDQVETQY